MKFLKMLKAEYRAIFSDFDILLTIFGGVILYAFLYPQPYLKESVSALPVAVVDYDHSDLSREISFMLDASAQMVVDSHYLSEAAAKNAIINNKVSALIIIPKHFKRDLYLGKEPVISVGADATYFLIYGGVVQGTMRSVLTESATVQVGNLLKKSVPMVTAKMQYTPFKIEFLNTFNVSSSYINYVVPAIYILILQQTLLIGMGMLGATQGQEMREGKGGYYSSGSIVSVMGVRYLAFGLIFSLHMLFYFGFTFTLFGVPHIAKVSELMIFSGSFLIAVLSLGTFLGALLKSRVYPTPVILITSLPLVFSAGFVWPLESMPQWLIWLSSISPSTPAIQGFLRLNQMGTDFSQVIGQFGLLWMQTAVYSALAYYMLRRQRQNFSTTKPFS